MTSTNTYVVYHINYSGDKLPAKNNSNITASQIKRLATRAKNKAIGDKSQLL